MPRCKAPEILRSEAYSEYASTEPVLSPPKGRMRRNAVDGRFSTASIRV